MGKIPSRGVDQFVLRFPDGLRDQIREVAERNGRSMNAEIIMRLEASLAPNETIGEALTGKWTLPDNTSDGDIDRAIHNAVAKALRELGIKRTVDDGSKDD